MRGHRYIGWVPSERARHFGGKSPDPQPVQSAPRKTDAEIQAEATSARLEAQRRKGRRASVLTSGNEPNANTATAQLSGSTGSPGQSRTIG